MKLSEKVEHVMENSADVAYSYLDEFYGLAVDLEEENIQLWEALRDLYNQASNVCANPDDSRELEELDKVLTPARKLVCL
jgi:hypothetical protein